MSWGEPPQQQPNQGQSPYGPWGSPPPVQNGGGYESGQQPQYAPPVDPYGAPQAQPQYGVPQQPQQPQQPYAPPPQYDVPQSQYGAPQPPQFGPPNYGAPDGSGGYQQPPAPKKGNGLIIGLSVGALVLVGGGVGAYLAFHKSSPVVPVSQPTTTASIPVDPTGDAPASTTPTTSPAGPTNTAGTGGLTLPGVGGGYTLQTTAAAQAKVASVYKQLSTPFTNSIVGVYGADGTDVLPLFVDQTLSADSPLLISNPANAVSGALAGDTDITIEQTNAPDGAMSCATIGSGSSSYSTCLWEDTKTVGFLTFDPQMSFTSGAALADALRAAAEG